VRNVYAFTLGHLQERFIGSRCNLLAVEFDVDYRRFQVGVFFSGNGVHFESRSDTSLGDFVGEVFNDAVDRVWGRLPKTTNRGIAHHLGEISEQG
jgi:hypothetical protein